MITIKVLTLSIQPCKNLSMIRMTIFNVQSNIQYRKNLELVDSTFGTRMLYQMFAKYSHCNHTEIFTWLY